MGNSPDRHHSISHDGSMYEAPIGSGSKANGDLSGDATRAFGTTSQAWRIGSESRTTVASAAQALRHPEKRLRKETPIQRKPAWIRVKAPNSEQYKQTRQIVRDHGLSTVCEEASCPNIGECWAQRHATFLIMGETCTRACSFCNVSTGRPSPLSADEPQKTADATAKLGLLHVVITSVDRDDLDDGGANHIALTVRAIRATSPMTTVEILTPDFKGKPGALERLLEDPPDVFNHNLETVPRLYPTIRPGARYFTSLDLLSRAKQALPSLFTKSGLMVGLGEQDGEVHQVMDDLRAADLDFLTVGQYLQPTRRHAAVDRFVTPKAFENLAARARAKGFLMVSASPLTRSSHHAGEDFSRLRTARLSALGPPSSRAL